jgi:hypothetical protein
LGLALVRDLRELRAPSNEDEVAAFETDVLAGLGAVTSCGIRQKGAVSGS